MITNGLYCLEFQTPLGRGAGVVVLANGVLQGGDSMMFYSGTYSEQGSKFSAAVHAGRHSVVSGMSSVFGVDNVHIALNGTTNGDSADAQGSAQEAPGVGFRVSLRRIN